MNTTPKSTNSQKETQTNPEKTLKPCCACPQTKNLRDQCILKNGEKKCQEFISAHKECLRSKGFKVD